MDYMSGKYHNIKLYGENHAIEVATFGVILDLPIDQADVRRFEQKSGIIKDLFPAVVESKWFPIPIGGQIQQQNYPPPPPVKELTFFANDGNPIWIGSFGENRILVSCWQYTRWEEVWPKAKARLDALLGCIDPYKTLHSVEFSVTDTFLAERDQKSLLPPNIFKKNNSYVPKQLLDLNDPRWDFNQGWFENHQTDDEILVRVEGQGLIKNELVEVKINNLHSQRFINETRVNEIISITETEAKSLTDNLFNKFHDNNKRLLRNLLVKELLSRMGLIQEDA